MPVIRHDFAMRNRDRIRPHVRVKRTHHAERRQRAVDIEMTAYGERVDPRVGTPGAVEGYLLSRHCLRGILDGLLDARPVLLPLQTLKGGSIEFESERKAWQAIIRPCATARRASRTTR